MTRRAAQQPRILIAGGGTGGHLFPGVAVAEALLDVGADVRFVGTKRGIEARVIPELGLPLYTIPVRGLSRVSWWDRAAFAAEAPLAVLQTLRVLLGFRPHVVVGVGGYASGPVVLAAAALGWPTAILEQNSIPGHTNRILGRVVRRVFSAFPEAARHFPPGKFEVVGNPVRRRIVEALTTPDAAPARPTGSFRIFAFGGSQGARGINELLISAAPHLVAMGVELVHQTGAADRARVAAAYREAGLDADVRDFVRDMAVQYAAADLLVCRAGATTLAELAIVGRPALLIPFPYASDNHQEKNARAVESRGGAICRREDELDGASLATLIRDLRGDPERMRALGESMRAEARPRAAQAIADELLDLASSPGAGRRETSVMGRPCFRSG